MKENKSDERALALIDEILKLRHDRFSAAKKSWSELAELLKDFEIAARSDKRRANRLKKITFLLNNAASKFIRSVSAANGPLADDWRRLAKRDFENFKDELLGLQEFILAERDFLSKALLRANLWKLGEVDPERLFKELHEAGAISERTWAVLVSHPTSRRDLKDRDASASLRRLAQLLVEIQEVRSGGKIAW